MSYSEIRHRKGMAFGGMPHDVLLHKLEETDPELVDEVGGFDEFHDMKDNYNNYVRSEIIDRAPDAPFLESDQTRRDASLSRSMINLRYNGTRGSDPDLPRHPELFYGFTGNDPRGVVNDPRFDQMRGHMTARAAGLTTRMGNNDDYQIAERPWTGQSISYAMKEVHRRQKANTRVFTVQKEGRPWSNNTTYDAAAAGDLRAAAMGAGGESLADRGAGAFVGAAPERFAGGDHGPADEAWTDGVRGVDAGHFGDVEVAPWRHSTGDTDLGIQKYGQKRGAGRSTIAPGAQGGGRLNASSADQDWARSERARSTNRQVLAATMASAARHRRAVKSGAHEQDPGQSYEAAGAPGSGLAPARDIALLYRHAVEDQSRRPKDEVQDGDGGALGSAAGLTPAANPERAIRASQAQATANSHLTNVGSIVAGLREGSAAGRRRIAGAVIADGARHLASSEVEAGTRRGAIPGTDLGRIIHSSEMPLARSAAAEGLVVHAYRGTPLTQPERRAELAQNAYDTATWRASHEALPLGSSKAPGEWRSQTQDFIVLGDVPDRVFGLDAEVSGYHGASPMGPKSLRAGGWSDSANLSDIVGGFSDAIDASA